MSKKNVRVEFEKLKDDMIELCYYDQPGKKSYLSWKIPIKEARDLAKWWAREGKQLSKRHLPVVKHKSRSVLVSMQTNSSVDVRGFDWHGGLKLLGYSLPRKVVECLSVWLQNGQQTQKTKSGIKGKVCSRKC